jgi:ankyrin repeat protein
MKTYKPNFSLFCKGLVCITLATIFWQTQARAQHETHGGEIVVVNGKLTLRDQIDNTNVFCKKGEEVVGQSTLWNAILDNSADLNWYVKRAYELEMNKMYFCFGDATLVKIDAEDHDAPYVAYSKDHQTVTVARRKGDIVYVNQAMFDEIAQDPKLFAGLLIHETTHGLVPESDPDRYTHVRSFTNDLLSLDPAHPLSAESFADQMKVNSIEISRNYVGFKKYKDDLALAFDGSASALERAGAAQRAILIREDLRPEDQYLLHSLLEDADLKADSGEYFRFAIEWDDPFLVKKMLALGADPNVRICGSLAIDYAITYDLRRVFAMLLEDARTDLSHAAETAYRYHRKSMLAALVTNPHVTISRSILDEMSKDADQDYFTIVQGKPAVMNSLGITAYLDDALPAIANSYDAKEREKAFQDHFVNGQQYTVAQLFGYAIYREFKTTYLNLFAVHPELAFVRNEQGDDLMAAAIHDGNLTLVTQLENTAGFKANELNPITGNSYLQTAVIYDQAAIVAQFKGDAGFNLNLRNSGGKTALDLAKEFHHQNIIQILSK